ncbi:MAG: hypothetical protein DMF81_14910 [Acidobacteria bacterium]|nr:MAG: hypothetical protein DMF81_14910 [Acidobacteriota bacterium]
MIRARLIVDELRRHGVTDVVGLPDNASKILLELLGAEPGIRPLTVTREGEAFAIASGLWVGGRAPVVLVQNTGLLVPLVCLVMVRGHGLLAARGLQPPPAKLDAGLLSRSDVDSVALLTEPTLRAWSVPWEVMANDADVPRIGAAFRRARELEQPVAVLIAGETS